MKISPVWMILFLASNATLADVGGRSDVQCGTTGNHHTKCVLTFDLSENARSYYRLYALDGNSLEWKAIKELHRSAQSINVQPEMLYRVLGCDDLQFTLNCISSSAAWAPSLRPVDEIPQEMMVTDTDGSVMNVGFVSNGDRYEILSQYNVYVLMDLTSRALIAGTDLPDMLPPIEDVDTPHRTLDHEVGHNTQAVYEGIRSQKNK